MSGRDERVDYVQERQRSQIEMDLHLIEQRETEAQRYIPDIKYILHKGGIRGDIVDYGFWVGKLYLSGTRQGPMNDNWYIITVRYKAGFFSKPVVLMYEDKGYNLVEILKFKNGPWTEYLVEAKSLSAERLIEYTRKQDEARTVATTLKRRERMKELGIDIDD